MNAFESISDLIRRRIYARRYAADRKKEGQLFAVRLDEGDYPVIYTTIGPRAPLGAANYLGRALESTPTIFLLFFSWASHGDAAVSRSRKALSVYNDLKRRHRFVFLCNSEQERQAHEAAGLEAILCNHNAFVDEAIFDIGKAPTRYDAVYNAAIAGWKRHELSRSVRSCLQITYRRTDVSLEETMSRLSELRQMMPSHTFANPVVDGHLVQLQATEVAALLNQCRCGLCLSAVEGAMFASIEYLLAGLAVVSTDSKGGRDEFASPEYWLNVSESPGAVADGVREVIKRNIPRGYIRNKTLARVHEHRARLRDVVEKATDGKVHLPGDLSHQVYRFATNVVPWPQVVDLHKVLGIEPRA